MKRGGLAGLLAGALCAGAVAQAQADPRFKNVALVRECRDVMLRTSPERTRYLEMELFNYEMSFSARSSTAQQVLLEDNLRQTCEVVSLGAGSGSLRVVRQSPWKGKPLDRPDYGHSDAPFIPAFRPSAAARAESVSRVAVEAPPAAASTVPGAWKRPLFESPAVEAPSSSWRSEGAVEGGLRRLLHMQ